MFLWTPDRKPELVRGMIFLDKVPTNPFAPRESSGRELVVSAPNYGQYRDNSTGLYRDYRVYI